MAGVKRKNRDTGVKAGRYKIGYILTGISIMVAVLIAIITIYYTHFHFQPDLVYTEFDLDYYTLLLPKEYQGEFQELSAKADDLITITNRGNVEAKGAVVIFDYSSRLIDDDGFTRFCESSLSTISVDSLVNYRFEGDTTGKKLKICFEPIPPGVEISIKHKAIASVSVIYEKGKAKNVGEGPVDLLYGRRDVGFFITITPYLIGFIIALIPFIIINIIIIAVYRYKLTRYISSDNYDIIDIVKELDSNQKADIIIEIVKSLKLR